MSKRFNKLVDITLYLEGRSNHQGNSFVPLLFYPTVNHQINSTIEIILDIKNTVITSIQLILFTHRRYASLYLCLHSFLSQSPQLPVFRSFLSSLLLPSLNPPPPPSSPTLPSSSSSSSSMNSDNTNERLGVLSLLYSIRHFSCSAVHYVHHSRCFLCLHHHLHTDERDYPIGPHSSTNSTSLDMNDFYFTLFDTVHSMIAPYLSSHILPKSKPDGMDIEICEAYCCVLSSLIYHTISVLATVICRNSMIECISNDILTQENVYLHQQMVNCWLFVHMGTLKEFLCTQILARPSIFTDHNTGILYLLFAFVRMDASGVGATEDISNNMIQMVAFQPLFSIVNTINEEFTKARVESEYRRLSYFYQTILNSIISVVGGVCVNLLFVPSLITQFSLLTSELFQWLFTSSELIADMALQQLIRLSRYSMKVYRKPLQVLLPECITARLVKTILELDQEKQFFIIQHVFDEQRSLPIWYSAVAPYVIPVYINLGDTNALVQISRAINPQSSVYTTLEQLFEGPQCIYNVLMYLLKHIPQGNKEAWELLFFLRSPFDDQAIESGNIILPKYSSVSIHQLVQSQGHRVLWPLLYDCTDVIGHDRQKSEVALESLYE